MSPSHQATSGAGLERSEEVKDTCWGSTAEESEWTAQLDFVPRIRQDVQRKSGVFPGGKKASSEISFSSYELDFPKFQSIRIREKENQNPLGPGKKWKETLGEIN